MQLFHKSCKKVNLLIEIFKICLKFSLLVINDPKYLNENDFTKDPFKYDDEKVNLRYGR